MNILSISQVQTQTAPAELGAVLPLQTSAPSQTERTSEQPSFAEALRDAQKASEREPREEERPVDSTQSERTVSRGEERTDASETRDEKTVGAKNEKNEKIARNSSSDDEKTDETPATISMISLLSAEEMHALDTDAKNRAVVQDALTVNTAEISESETPRLVLSDGETEIDDKVIDWLLSSAKTEEKGDDISSAEFASLIDAAVEFIPGAETDDEKLANAQNLASSDPELFLKNAEQQFVQTEGVSKSRADLSLTDKKSAQTTTAKDKKNELKLAVHDLRTRHVFEDASAKVDATKAVQKSAEKKEITLSMQQQNETNVQMTMELAAKAQENITSSSSQAAAASGSDFQQMLSNAVQDNAPDFVKAGNIVLKDNNQGTINLVLKPEGLGNVKISLNLDDKNLSAQITVQTKEAMDAFRESIQSLKQAFTESGFETGSFDLNFSNQQQNFAQGDGNQSQQKDASFLAHQSYGEFVTASALASGDVADAYAGGDYSVNIVA